MSVNVAEVFGQDVFNEAVMKERLPEVTYKQMVKLMNEGGEVTLELADIVAKAMKEWAIEKGATHYTHIFQPYIVSIGAEKHDSFADIPKGGKIENCFSGKDLMMGEPDASSFPSGGLRATCAARGYTAWDVGSPAYVKDGILCIPTAFCSYLIYAGRTLFGAPAPKGQEMEDQYFGPLKTKIADFMADVDEQLWKLGITVKTQHNEVAPGQHEIAPIFAPADAALDSNFLVMDVLKSTATKHGLACLLHEKPFAGVNGSGKHNNWSLGTDNGVNLFKPGKEPNKNLQFLCVLACLMEAVNKHALLLRAAASNTGNDHRLGANEAPPAIISIYMGDQLGEIVDAIVAGVPFDQLPCAEVGTLDLGVSTLPVLPKDPTDRNRTSPFAFTGNRFEFRMVASSVSIGDANTVMNSMMAESFNKACDALEGAEDFEKAAIDYIYKTMKENKNIVFNGNGYSDEWVEEAAKRGLPNVKSIVDAIPAYTDESSIEMFEKLGVMTKRELEARREIKLEEYAGLINIEARTMIDMAAKLYIPSVIAYVNSVASSMSTVKNAYAQADTTAQQTILVKASSLLADTQQALDNLKAATDAAESAKDFHEKVLPAMAALRTPVDELETIVDSEYWPVPTYGQMMFEV